MVLLAGQWDALPDCSPYAGNRLNCPGTTAQQEVVNRCSAAASVCAMLLLPIVAAGAYVSVTKADPH
jgi:hypothetical protein